MGKRRFKLTAEEEVAIRQREDSTRATDELNRLKAVRLYGTGMEMEQVLNIVSGSGRSVQRWVARYQAQGIAGLQSHWSGMNAAKLSTAQMAEIKDRLESYTPEQLIPAEMRINQGQFWTVSDLRIMAERWYGVTYQDADSYQQLFHKCNFSYQRPERVYKSRPSEAEIAAFEAELEKK
jgi:transposase